MLCGPWRTSRRAQRLISAGRSGASSPAHSRRISTVMPAPSKAQRRLFAIAEHHPEQLNPENRHLADLPHKTLHEFASTPEKDLPYKVARKRKYYGEK